MMKRVLLLSVMGALSCGRLLTVGDQSSDETELKGGRASCGENTCAVGDVCCNASCGICTPPGGACTQQLCSPSDAGRCSPVTCTLACQHGFQKGADGCDVCACAPAPDAGSCGHVTCTLACQYGFQKGADGCEVCACAPAPDAGLGPCYRGGCSNELCSEQQGLTSTCDFKPEFACYQAATCERQASGRCGFTPSAALTACLVSSAPSDAGATVSCGSATCGAGLECCNASCGMCAPPGVACTQQVCAPADAGSCGHVTCTLACQYGFKHGADGCEVCECAPGPSCGVATCGAGTTCCNASCGICTPPGLSCTQQVCTR